MTVLRSVLAIWLLVVAFAYASTAAYSWSSFTLKATAARASEADDARPRLYDVAAMLSGQRRELLVVKLQSSTTTVATPAQLQAAIASGARHISVEEHMDLLKLPHSELGPVLGVALNTTLSITGNCATAPGPALSPSTGPAMRPLLPGQCLLLTDTSVLTVTNSSLWMDNLYLRLQRSARTPLKPSFIKTEAESPALYLTGISLQVRMYTCCTAALNSPSPDLSSR
eukprot:jgi/Ulvmu1/8592/UM045_0035.1